MYRKQPQTKTTIKVNAAYQGETIEQKINRIVNNKEPITDGAPIIYTERHEGVNPAYDIRTDRWEIAVDAMDKVTASDIAKRERRIDDKKAQKEGFKDHEAKLAAQNAKTEGNQQTTKDNQ